MKEFVFVRQSIICICIAICLQCTADCKFDFVSPIHTGEGTKRIHITLSPETENGEVPKKGTSITIETKGSSTFTREHARPPAQRLRKPPPLLRQDVQPVNLKKMRTNDATGTKASGSADTSFQRPHDELHPTINSHEPGLGNLADQVTQQTPATTSPPQAKQLAYSTNEGAFDSGFKESTHRRASRVQLPVTAPSVPAFPTRQVSSRSSSQAEFNNLIMEGEATHETNLTAMGSLMNGGTATAHNNLPGSNIPMLQKSEKTPALNGSKVTALFPLANMAPTSSTAGIKALVTISPNHLPQVQIPHVQLRKQGFLSGVLASPAAFQYSTNPGISTGELEQNVPPTLVVIHIGGLPDIPAIRVPGIAEPLALLNIPELKKDIEYSKAKAIQNLLKIAIPTISGEDLLNLKTQLIINSPSIDIRAVQNIPTVKVVKPFEEKVLGDNTLPKLDIPDMRLSFN